MRIQSAGPDEQNVSARERIQDEDFDHAEIVSFDVYDTIITRLLAKPEDLHLLVAHRAREYLDDDSAYKQWAQVRIEAESIARKEATKEDITLDEIYAVLVRKWPKLRANLIKVKKEEIAAEVEICVPKQTGKKLLSRARDAKKRIIFVSDMYLPKQVIWGILSRFGLAIDGDELYVSGELGRSKAKGGLFRYIQYMHCRDGENLLHIGDNIHSDFMVPTSMGIKAIRLPVLDLAAQHVLIHKDLSPAHALQWSLIFGVSAAVMERYADFEDQNLCKTSAYTSAPILVLFVAWIFSVLKGPAARIAFTARDGQILYKIFNILLEAKITDATEARYVYFSRAACKQLAEAAKSYLLTTNKSEEARRNVFSWCRAALGQLLDDRPQNHIDEAGSNPSEGGAKPIFFVDLGWHGSLQRDIEAASDALGVSVNLRGLYFAIRGERANDPKYLSFLGSTIKFHPDLIEAMCFADHGTTTGFDSRGKPEVAVEQRSVEELNRVRKSHEIVEDYARVISENWTIFSEIVPPSDYGAIANAIAMRLSAVPTKWEAEFLGALRHCPNALHENEVEIAPIMSVYKMVCHIISGDRQLIRWRSGCVRRSIKTDWLATMINRSNRRLRSS